MSTGTPAAGGPAYRVVGPSALGGVELRRCWNLAVTLALNEFKVRFFGSALGYAWSLLRPLALFGILYFVFSEVVDAGAGVEHYPVSLLMAMILFWYFGEVTSGCLTGMADRETLLRKVGFPRIVVPVAVILGALLNLGLNLVVLAVFVVVNGVDPQLTWLLLPLPLAVLTAFAAGLGMLLGALYVSYRDVQPVWDVVLQALFYGTPIIYPIELALRESQSLGQALLYNPVGAIIQETRYLLVGPDASPSLVEAIGSAGAIAAPIAIAIALSVLGLVVFDRLAPSMAENL